MLEISQLNKIYRGPDGLVSAVEGASIQVRAGEFLAVRGPSGCGKTTLLLCAGALLAPDKGRITVAGVDPYALALNAPD